MYMCARGIPYASVYDFPIRFWTCSDDVGFLFYQNINQLMCVNINAYKVEDNVLHVRNILLICSLLVF